LTVVRALQSFGAHAVPRQASGDRATGTEALRALARQAASQAEPAATIRWTNTSSSGSHNAMATIADVSRTIMPGVSEFLDGFLALPVIRPVAFTLDMHHAASAAFLRFASGRCARSRRP
jgi:hypothetical protein